MHKSKGTNTNPDGLSHLNLGWSLLGIALTTSCLLPIISKLWIPKSFLSILLSQKTFNKNTYFFLINQKFPSITYFGISLYLQFFRIPNSFHIQPNSLLSLQQIKKMTIHQLTLHTWRASTILSFTILNCLMAFKSPDQRCV